MNPYLAGNFGPVRRETDAPELALVAGALPDDLAGTLYRVGPAPRFVPRDPDAYHWFDGDGMIDAFRIGAGRVAHCRRWVQTDKLRLEERAGRALFGGLRDFGRSTTLAGWRGLGMTPPALLRLGLGLLLGAPPRDGLMRAARAHDRGNTNVVFMAGRLLALEESAAGWEIDPDTLSTRARFDFDGAIATAMSAHPKVDPQSGAVYTMGASPIAPYLTYYAFDRDGALRFRRDIDVPFPAMMHDFSVTATRAVFYHLPATFRVEHLASGKPFRWEPAAGARIGVVARDDPRARVRWTEIPPCYVFHQMNAYDDGDELVLDVACYPRLPLFDMGSAATSEPGDSAGAQLERWQLDPARGSVRRSVLDDTVMEFPVVDPRFGQRRYRYGWAASRRRTADRRGLVNAIAFYDHQTGAAVHRELGPSRFVSEPIFAPRAGSTHEGDGYLLVVVYDADADASELMVLDARAPDRDAVAVIRCPHRIPYGFHGTWLADARALAST